LTFQSIRLFPSTRPIDVNLTDGGRIKAYTLEDYTNLVEKSETILVLVNFTGQHTPGNANQAPILKLKVTISLCDPIKPIFDTLSKKLHLETSDIVLEFKGVRVYPLSIPKNVGIEDGNLLSGYIASEYTRILEERVSLNYKLFESQEEERDVQNDTISPINIKVSLANQSISIRTLPVVNSNTDCAYQKIVPNGQGKAENRPRFDF
jgi:hypothetical protein